MLLLINTIFFIDLYLVLINPFYSKKLREKKYWLLLVINFPIVTCIVTYQVTRYSDGGSDIIDFAEESHFIYFWKIFVVALFVFTTFTAISVLFLLSKQGTSLELKKKVRIRHMVYFVLYALMICNTMSDIFWE